MHRVVNASVESTESHVSTDILADTQDDWECVELEFAFHLATHNCADAVCPHIDSGDLFGVDDHDRMVRVGIEPGQHEPSRQTDLASLV